LGLTLRLQDFPRRRESGAGLNLQTYMFRL